MSVTSYTINITEIADDLGPYANATTSADPTKADLW